jgi:FAD/FMN-containing dehydrogenase
MVHMTRHRASTLPAAIRDFAGNVIAPGEPAFETARRVQNDIVDRRPALIARCTSARDVAAALRHARETGLEVRVRGGGHGPDGFAVADGALVVDLSRMRHVLVDPVRRTLRVQGGATWREVDAATGSYGLAVPGARIPSVGVAGFTLGSGSGWLERKLGLAADSLRCAQVVTAEGRLVTADPDSHPDLFWALRGGGPGFGVVVELEFALHPVGPMVIGGMLAWPAARAAEIAEAYVAHMATAPDDLGGGLALFRAPPAAFVPDVLEGASLVAIVVLWTGPAADGRDAIAPLRKLGPAIDSVGPMPYAALQGMFESPQPYTARIHGEGGFLSGLPPEAVAVLAAHHARKPVALGNLLLQPMGGAFARVADGATPLGHRDAAWLWQASGAWFDPDQDDAMQEWAASLRAALAPWSHGESYPNFIPGADPVRLRAAYGPKTWARLRAIRAEWDPDDVLSGGHAIPLSDGPARDLGT